jgi:hypothetical protein
LDVRAKPQRPIANRPQIANLPHIKSENAPAGFEEQQSCNQNAGDKITSGTNSALFGIVISLPMLAL